MTCNTKLLGLLMLSLLASNPAHVHASEQKPSEQLVALDKQLAVGEVEFLVHRNPVKPDGDPTEYRAKLVFQRPEWFELTLQADGKDLHLEGEVSDPDAPLGVLARALLGGAGQLQHYFHVTDCVLANKGKGQTKDEGEEPQAARLEPKAWGSEITEGVVWVHEGKVIGMELMLPDGTQLFLAVLRNELG